ncbi:MAG TPA: class I SAM-dependent rRNA methyltransferase, partial [Syntrophobacteria bacterium]|nr:class I SAM-dependent rRNA methyltransferase [Syntrophobacteria bacterium]
DNGRMRKRRPFLSLLTWTAAPSSRATLVHTIQLKKNEERRILAGHSWIFSNEIHDVLHGVEPGDVVRVVSASGRFLGIGHVSPNSLIAIRLLSRRQVEIDRAFYRQRLLAAEERRRWLYPGSSVYRLVFGEADLLPGLIVDRYDRHLVVQVLTRGMAQVEDVLLDILREVFQPASIVLRNDSPMRRLEGLFLERRLALGELPDPLLIELDGIRFVVAPLEGQKTGFYLDQRENRPRLRGLAHGKRVLDACCYEAAWGVYAARFGASEVVGVDVSEAALARARQNVQVNGLETPYRFVARDIFDFLTEGEEQFDAIILDPPAFIKSKAKLREGERGYLEINRLAMKLLPPGGVLVTCSCSHHLSRDRFQVLLGQAARLAKRRLRLLEACGQSRDHPVLMSMPETAYLKCFILEVLPID